MQADLCKNISQCVVTGIAPGGTGVCARQKEPLQRPLHRGAPGGKGELRQAVFVIKVALEGRWRLAVRHEPPGGVNLFRQVVLVGAPGACVTGYEL